MKTLAVLFLTAFAFCVSANRMAVHKAVFDFLDERHDHNMAQVVRDYGLPKHTLVAHDHPEPPEEIKSCIVNGKSCWDRTGHEVCKKLECVDDFYKCVKENLPPAPEEVTPLLEGCELLLKMCREHSPSCAGELCCFVRIKRCFELVHKEKK